MLSFAHMEWCELCAPTQCHATLLVQPFDYLDAWLSVVSELHLSMTLVDLRL